MNIIIGLSVIISALVIRHNFKVKGEVSERIFKMCVATGVFMLFSVQTFGNAGLIAMTAAEILLCTALLYVYRAQLIREKNAARSKKAVCRETTVHNTVKAGSEQEARLSAARRYETAAMHRRAAAAAREKSVIAGAA